MEGSREGHTPHRLPKAYCPQKQWTLVQVGGPPLLRTLLGLVTPEGVSSFLELGPAYLLSGDLQLYPTTMRFSFH